jgi:hypothetical protein
MRAIKISSSMIEDITEKVIGNEDKIVFYTTNNTIFSPYVTKSGAAITWNLGNGDYLNANSINYAGYVDSNIKRVRITNVDNYANITDINLSGQNIQGSIKNLNLLTNIQNIILNINQINDCLVSLSYFPQLQQFNIANNQLIDLHTVGLLENLILFDVSNNNLTSESLNNLVKDMWKNRINLGTNNCIIKLENNTGTLTAESISMIGDLISEGCTVTY